MSKRLIVGLAALLCLSSCASIMVGSYADVYIHNLPPNARVFYEGYNLGNSNIVSVHRRNPGQLRIFSDSCYQEINFRQEPMYGFIAVDIIFGFYPLVIDLLAGNLNRPVPGDVFFNCVEIRK